MTVEWQNILKKLPIFSALDKKEIDSLIEASEEKEYERDDVVIREGERGNSIFIIGSGSVEVVLPWRGEKTLHLTTLGKGEYFGEVALFEKPSRRSATIIAVERCVLLEIDGSEFLILTKTHPEIVMEVIENVTSRLRDIGEQVIKVKLRDMDEKIDTLNTRLEAELRATGATLNATQTVFDQTSRRANEIIESAERSRTRLTTTASLLGTAITGLVAVFGFLGFSQLQSVDELAESVEKKAEIIDGKMQDVENNAAKIEEIMTVSIKSLEDVNEKFNTIIVNHYKQIVLPQFADELRKDINKAGKMYLSMLKLQDPGITNEPFKLINLQLFAADTDEVNELLEMLETADDGYNKNTRQQLLTYFTKLLAFIIQDDEEKFGKTYKDFKEYAQENPDSSIKEALQFNIYISAFGEEEDKKEKLMQVWNRTP